ncbi:MAG: LPD5 domain-containing protein, partial [Cloacibacillus porcorum]|nr:LPD5 domain-containing protein [Cloacibacillus porcorum]
MGRPHEYAPGAGDRNRPEGDSSELTAIARRPLTEAEFLLLTSEPASGRIRRRGSEPTGQLSLFPTEEEQREEIAKKVLSSDTDTPPSRRPAPKEKRPLNLSDEQIDAAILNDDACNNRYLIYKSLSNEKNDNDTIKLLRDEHKRLMRHSKEFLAKDKNGVEKEGTIYAAEGGLRIKSDNRDYGPESSTLLSWGKLRREIFRLMYEGKFITEDEIAVREGNYEPKGLPEIPQGEIDRAIMPPYWDRHRTPVIEIISNGRRDEESLSELKEHTDLYNAKPKYEYSDGKIGRVAADDEGIFFEKPGCEPAFVSWEQAYDRLTQIIVHGNVNDFCINNHTMLTTDYIDALICRGPAFVGSKDTIRDYFSTPQERNRAEDEDFLRAAYGAPFRDRLVRADDISKRYGDIEGYEGGLKLHIDGNYSEDKKYTPGEDIDLSWGEVSERLERLIASGVYMSNDGPEEVYDRKDGMISTADLEASLMKGTGFTGDKNRIAAAYQSGSREEFVAAVLKEYDRLNMGYREADGRGRKIYNGMSSDINGRFHRQKTIMGTEVEHNYTFDIEKIADIIGGMIERGEYLTPEEQRLSPDEIARERAVSEEDIKSVFLEINSQYRLHLSKLYQDGTSNAEIENELKRHFGTSGGSFMYNGMFHGWREFSPGSGVKFNKAEQNAQISYSQARKVIATLIAEGRFVTEAELAAAKEERESRYLSDEDVKHEERGGEEKEGLSAAVENINDGVKAPAAVAENYRITDDMIGVGTPVIRLTWNIQAIQILKDIEKEKRPATAEEQGFLAQYVGWGGLADSFGERIPDGPHAQLKELLTEREYEAARASTLTAYYTPPVVARSIYDTLERFGFTGGNILEPSKGVGNYYGVMPEEMVHNSRLYGVELDDISGRIAKQLYPKADIKICGYEKADYPDSFFDVAVGNIPFGQMKVVDLRYEKLNMPIHDYFIAKTLDKVRPGGIVAFVTSRYTMDKEKSASRRYFTQRAELLGAVRLPNTTFKAAAGTEVTADILFLQKRGRILDIEPEWVFTGKNEDGIVMNEYFVKHPEKILGSIVMKSCAWVLEPACTPLEGRELAELLAEVTGKIKGEIPTLDIILDEDERRLDESIPADPTVRNFSYTVSDGRIYYRENSRMYPKAMSVEMAGRCRSMIKMCDKVRELIDCQLHDGTDSDVGGLQRELRVMYDRFAKRYGIINSRSSAQAFKGDSGYYLLCSLEILDDERKKVVRLADMFTKRTIRRSETPVHAQTAEDALAISISERAGVNMGYMLTLLGDKSEEDVVKELEGRIFRDPIGTLREEKNVYVTADEYLSGDIAEKLKMAKLAEERDTGSYAVNIAALEKVMPEKIPAGDIGIHLGSTWVDDRYVRQFIVELLEPSPAMLESMKVIYMKHTASWAVTSKNMDYGNTKADVTYRTKNVNAYKLIEDALNGKFTTVFRTEQQDGKDVRVFDKIATAEAQKKQEIIKAKFKDWIFADIERREYLTEKYNSIYNTTRPRVYDGSHIAFTGMNPEIRLNKHQRDGAARILYGPNTLLGHVVGAGKTFVMVAATMESKRIGITHKSLYVVPNYLTVQLAAEFMRLYPAANLLVATARDFESANRKTICSRIATGDFDAVILGYSQFEKLPLSEERQLRYLEEQRTEILNGIADLEAADAPRYSVKRMEKIRDNVETRIKSIKEHLDVNKDDVITFEELGVDRLFVDEAHYFKNLMTITKLHNVAGVSTSAAAKSMDLFLKCRYMDELTGGKGITFATGTPISNSMVEMYTMERYLQFNELQRRGISHFDAWAANFGETVMSIELAPEGTGFRGRTRFARFVNLPDLTRMFSAVADIKVAEDLNLPVPKANFINVAVPPSPAQEEMIAELSERAEQIRNGEVKPEEDNMLLITNDGRKIGLDQRLMDPALPDNPGSKVNACVENVRRIWEEGQEARTTQLIFCDFSTPDKDRFNLYYDVKDKLVAAGVPEEEIAFIHSAKSEAQKAALFAQVRAGRVRVLMGSTVKMGAGTNVQDRLIASHDLDCPWRPSDLEQRAGRIVRQGNNNKEVFIYRYVTERTFDAYLYQTIENKQKFIAQIMTNKSPLRSCSDIDESVLQYAEVKALCAGDPRIKEKMELDIDVTRLQMLKSAYQSNRYEMEYQVRKLPEEIVKAKENVASLKADAEHLNKNTFINNDNKFSPMEICGKICTVRKSAGESLLLAKELAAKSGQRQHLGRYRGFELYMSYQVFGGEYYATLVRGEGTTQHHVTMGADVIGNTMRLDNQLNNIVTMAQMAEKELAAMEKRLKDYSEELKKPFEQEEELERKSARLAELDILINLDNKGERSSTKNTARVFDTEASNPPIDGSRAAEISDFGEKLGGARKDAVAFCRHVMETLLPEGDIASLPLSKTFPAPDYAKLLEAGMDREALRLIHAVRDAIPAKPQKFSHSLDRYVAAVKSAREFTALMLASPEKGVSEAEDWLKLTGLPNPRDIRIKGQLYGILGHDVSLKDVHPGQHLFTRIDGQDFNPPALRWCLRKNSNSKLVAMGETLEDLARDFVRRRELENGSERNKQKYTIYHYKKRPGYYIGKKIGSDYVDFAGPLKTVKEAAEYLENNAALLDEKLERFKVTPFKRREDNAPRVGSDTRDGRDVTPEMFAEAFGFRGVEFGNWVGREKRQSDLNEAYDALMDLAAVTGLPP